MKIIIISNIEWSDENAFGNTISNWFYNINNIDFLSIYRRYSQPNNSVCKKYYKIKPLSIIWNYFTPDKIGEEFDLTNCNNQIEYNNGLFEKKIIHCFHKVSKSILPIIENWLYSTKKWKNQKFINKIKLFNPDIVFFFIGSSLADYQISTTIKELIPSCKIVGFIADDVYGVTNNKSKKKTIEKCISLADLVYGCSEILAENYSKMFNVKIDTLYKGCTFDKDIIQKNNIIKTIVYAGNLHYGRLETLAVLAKCIEEHNKINDIKIELNIYTNEILNQVQQDSLNIEGASKLCGSRSYGEIKKILDQADVVLHAESFLEKNIKVVRYSFSTKIIDCLQSNSVLLAIGPSKIASIDFATKVPGAFVVKNFSELPLILEQISNENLYKRSLEMRRFAIEKFDIKNIQNKILSDFKKLIQ